jgi:serine/threonine protein kinase
MSLSAGTRLGPYEILSAIGAGGMGEVYRARDTKLGRDVALKVIPDTFALDPDRLARFTREAHVLASLNHPHIAAIYGFEDSVKPTRSYSNWWRARRSLIGSRAAPFRWMKRCRSRVRSVRRSKRRTSRESSIAI